MAFDSAASQFGYYPEPVMDFCEKPTTHFRFYPARPRKIEYIIHPDEETALARPLEYWFNEHADKWAMETGVHSSPVIRFMHEDYQAIIAKGPQIIPLILKRMRNKPDDWFWALRYLADEDAALNVQGFDAAVAAWLKWGADRGYISK
jgi:hypothetical protein